MAASERTVAIQMTIRGRVQGVGFRYYTHREARRRNLGGWVKNKYDGTVEVYAEGPEEQITEFERWLRQGPPAAHVTDVSVRRPHPTEAYPRFTIEYS